MTALAHGRYTIEVPPEHAPDDLLDELRRGGAQIVSLNPLRETLEDYFVQSVARGRDPADRPVSVRTIAVVAGAVFKESVRDRVPYPMVAFATLLIAASYLISQLTAGQDLKIIKDLGLAAISWFGLLIAVFIGIGLVSKEVERRSVFGVLSKPISRGQFVLGKYFGLVMTLVVNLAVMTLAFYAVLFYLDVTTVPYAKARGRRRRWTRGSGWP